MNINIKLEKIEKELFEMRSKVALLKYIDPELTFVKNVPLEVKELLFGVTSVSENLFISLDICLDNLYSYVDDIKD